MTDKLLTVDDLSAGYGNQPLLHNISFSLEPGETLSIIAPNGAGKSTLLKCITGLLPLMAGGIQLKGKPMTAWSRRELARMIAMVRTEETENPFPAEQVVLMGRYAHIPRFSPPSSDDWAIVRTAMEQTGIWHKRQAVMAELSQGEKQKVLIARAIAQCPDILLLDEPTSHLDVANQYIILSMIKKLAQERRTAILAVIHDINLALQFSTRLMIIHNGQIAAIGSGDEILASNVLESVYGIPFQILRHNRVAYVHAYSEMNYGGIGS
ncbi:ABC transporter ATP-binding protein [Acetonema longum]|uniref:Putative iron compound ABC transporter ATP binding protein n=1 Tax=Acetonema longum DSM 6540 TaxID=1009370 RepID=F7NPU9_9FIRM|nr:ABC transporter ATP-binding protein [Acetonema longum]EGO61940.1 putative iron compound ABC transporter ATP binding protein [Acetonema longum DSM 6540]